MNELRIFENPEFGEVRDVEISTDILEKALKNTVKLVDDMTVAR